MARFGLGQEARVYTSSVQALPTAIARHFDKSTALEIQRHPQLHRGDAGMQLTGLGRRQTTLTESV